MRFENIKQVVLMLMTPTLTKDVAIAVLQMIPKKFPSAKEAISAT